MHHHPLALLLILTVGLAAGCSSDRQVIHSTPLRPVSVAVVDGTTDDTVWSMDIAVNHTLVLDFDHPSDRTGKSLANVAPTTMRYQVFRTPDVETDSIDANDYTGKTPIESGRIDLPPHQVVIEQTFRPAPELESAAPQPAPVPLEELEVEQEEAVEVEAEAVETEVEAEAVVEEVEVAAEEVVEEAAAEEAAPIEAEK